MKTTTLESIVRLVDSLEDAVKFNANETLEQIGTPNLMFVSGGRVLDTGKALVLPVGNGYSVLVYLTAMDTYEVLRVFIRGGKATVKKSYSDVYCDEIGEIVREASCYHNN